MTLASLGRENIIELNRRATDTVKKLLRERLESHCRVMNYCAKSREMGTYHEYRRRAENLRRVLVDLGELPQEAL